MSSSPAEAKLPKTMQLQIAFRWGRFWPCVLLSGENRQRSGARRNVRQKAAIAAVHANRGLSFFAILQTNDAHGMLRDVDTRSVSRV